VDLAGDSEIWEASVDGLLIFFIFLDAKVCAAVTIWSEFHSVVSNFILIMFYRPSLDSGFLIIIGHDGFNFNNGSLFRVRMNRLVHIPIPPNP
jgi:hypothetical protein